MSPLLGPLMSSCPLGAFQLCPPCQGMQTFMLPTLEAARAHPHK